MTHAEFTDALERSCSAPERKVLMSAADRRRTAYHEGGHALVGMLTDGVDPVRKISIIPRGQSLGVTLAAPNADRSTYSDRELRARIASRWEGGPPRRSSSATSPREPNRTSSSSPRSPAR